MIKGFADKIFMNGDIVTVDETNPSAEAVAVKDGKIMAVGPLSEVNNLIGTDTEMVDLLGKTLLPGLIEPHTHPELSAFFYSLVDVSSFTFKTRADVLKAIESAVKNTPKGEWIACFGLDTMRIRDIKKFTLQELDAISSEHPIVIMIQSMHTTYGNTMAFESAGVTKDTTQFRDGGYGKDENGELNGEIIEQTAAMPFFMDYIQKMKQSPIDLIQEQIKRYVKAGITSVWTAGFMQIFPQVDTQQIFRELVDNDNAGIRMFYVNHVGYVEGGMVDTEKDIRKSSDRFGCSGVKFWYDGSPYTGNMLLEDNYLNSELMQSGLGVKPDQAGESVYEFDMFSGLIKKYNDFGYQISVHSQGDRSTKEVLDAFEEAYRSTPGNNSRHRLEHCALLPVEQMIRMKTMGISPSFHSNHIRYYGEALREDILGEERAKRLMPAKTALEQGLKISFHADSPMYPAEPLNLIKTAVTRMTEKGEVIGAEEGITVDQAIRGVTLDAAWQMFMEDRIGSIEVGKYADFTVLDQNPKKIDPKHIDAIQVVGTYVEGNRIEL